VSIHNYRRGQTEITVDSPTYRRGGRSDVTLLPKTSYMVLHTKILLVPENRLKMPA
jgi:hypothetical protein